MTSRNYAEFKSRLTTETFQAAAKVQEIGDIASEIVKSLMQA